MANSIFVDPASGTSYTPGSNVTFTTPIYLPDGSASAPSLTFASETNSGGYRVSAGLLGWSIGGTAQMFLSSSGLQIQQSVIVGGNTTIASDAANTLALRNGTNAQAAYIYNTVAGANYERANLGWTSNEFFLQTTNGGTGSGRNLIVKSSGNLQLLSNSGANTGWVITSGHFIAALDNTYDIGASGATRPRNVYAGGSYNVGTGFGVFWGSRSNITSPGDGVLLFRNNAETDFSRLQFGGTTSSFPALKRNSTALEVRLADDSAYGALKSARTSINQLNANQGSGALLIDLVTAPTISSGFGTSPSIVANNGTAAFTVNVGTGGSATSGVIGLPTATTGWNCFVENITAMAANRGDQRTVQTASTTTSVTLQNQTISTGAALAWTAGDILRISCFAY